MHCSFCGNESTAGLTTQEGKMFNLCDSCLSLVYHSDGKPIILRIEGEMKYCVFRGYIYELTKEQIVDLLNNKEVTLHGYQIKGKA